MALDLTSISIEQLKKEILNRKRPEPLFTKNGIQYYDVLGYQKLLEYFDEEGLPNDLTPIEFNPDGSAKNLEPQYKVINLEAYVSNRVRTSGKSYHIVIDTRTIRESESGNVSLAFIPEYVLTENASCKTGYSLKKGTVTREDFLKSYTEAFGVSDMLSLLEIIEKSENEAVTEATLKLPKFKAKGE